MKPYYNLILASKSPRRKELLSYSELPFEIFVSGIEEKSEERSPEAIVMDLAFQKGEAVFQELKKRPDFNQTFFPFVVAADTLVFLGSKALGTPHSEEAAREMLKELSGKTHTVLTGVCFHCCGEKTHRFFVESEVTFAPLSEDLLERYLQTKDPLDKAGAYGIQGPALTFISSLKGSYSNVVGFPLHEFLRELESVLGPSWRRLLGKGI